MKETIVLLVFLACCAVSIWITAKKSSKIQKELEESNDEKNNATLQNEILANYINMSSAQLLDRVHAKRQAAQKRMHSENRLDR